ncbi:N-acetyl-gamma-glutamyl-phosphate reductase [Acinetobacter radioresistens]|uniref:N-acetyl-gamma-glutamyl-phosphate reductase n=1 Tax=Acinetobacter radioresistens SK82 TaxID=596318 RepID=A0ABP2GJ38_ACIRA|nr:N-acetyl-gamma-glutamyl-phosphate reductase [Acinetobacter radioresistens SK82]EEY87551.1 N-acetyl-gamma-glutamyl-phosphate reductase [Acinetobacter radioresistens SH164]ENV87875.1 N-acetyl-gamma-glutamyl-phosphate reductase [Acinetobacter radioresistens NIPH 2130]EXE56870.1 N-acetyl-gamma-glutamyl-phosphate reductase [Acinetobacter sp. 1239920]EXF57099.1 N-acetyl-gamma-glutamyl-phosphate reductase [Acinetobacter sp. 1294596]MBA5696680.1 N-acetyl-gamma-glutamyl-phosphate reductase [Acinetob
MISVGIVGGTGYTGVELLRLLLRHPDVQVSVLTSRTEAGKRVDDMFPSLRGHTDLQFSDLDMNVLKHCDVVFFATPHGVAMKHAAELVAANTKVIDLAADFRLQNLQQFEKWYGLEHSCPDILTESVYGLTELNREKIKQAKVVGNPGCYPTTVQLGLAPLFKSEQELVKPASIIIDAKSGVSGAGRKASLGMIYSENADNFKAYGVAGHRHHPEIVEALENISGQSGVFDQILFIPHLVPMIRGMFSTIYVDLTEQGQNTDLQSLYEIFYADEQFVDVMPSSSSPETRSVRGANQLRIALYKPQPTKLVILVVQDNLVKGAAGQAVQNMNLMFGFAENAGLTGIGLLP